MKTRATLLSPALWVTLLLTLLATYLREGEVVPWRNEYFYLVRLFRTYQPEFIPVDWSLAGGAPEHFLFNHVFGTLAAFLPLESIAILGRGLCWSANLLLLLLLGRRLGLPPWLAFLPLLAWIGWGQSLVAQSWILGTFEAKCVSYAFLIAALLASLDDRWRTAGFAVGLSFSFHPSVGLWGGLAVAAVAIPPLLGFQTRASHDPLDSEPGLDPTSPADRPARREFLFATLLAVAGAAPGLIATLPMVFGSHASSESDWAFMTRVKMPHHLDPETWPIRVLAVLPALLLFNGVHAWVSGSRAWRRVFGFQLAIAVPFGLGLVARELESYRFLSYFPFRLFPLFVPLLFLFAVAESIHRVFGDGETAESPDSTSSPGRSTPRRTRAETQIGLMLAALGALALLALPEPFSPYSQAFSRRLHPESDVPPGLEDCFLWIRDHTLPEAQGIAPPGLDREFWYLAERGLVVSSEFQSYDRLSEWKRRVEMLGGPMIAGPERRPSLTRHFEGIPQRRMESIAQELSADFLVSRRAYPSWPVAFESGEYRVYLTGDPSVGNEADGE